jgi:hypothetical protein
MDEDAPHTMRWPRVFARVAGGMVLGAVLYVLSIGPVVYFLGQRSDGIDQAVESFYAPISWLVDRTGQGNPIVPYASR